MKKHSLWARVTSILMGVVVGVSLLSFAGTTANAQSEVLTGKTATEISGMLGKGFNLGNTFDATGGKSGDIYSFETSWGNPVVVKELIDGIKAAGYSSIRIPCTWAKHMDKGNNYAVDPEFFERMKEVIDWCYEDDLFVILNVHHEGWLNKETFCEDYKEIGDRLGILWSQIADYFKDYDQHLIFEGMNEPRAQGTSYEWTGNEEGYAAVNYLNQVFVNAVRTNAEGYNAERVLGIPGYAASNSAVALRAIEIPEFNGEPVNNVMISIHCYSPYEFCLTDKQTSFSPTNSGDTSDIKRMMSDIKTLFTDNGIPAYIGECGATNSGDNLEARIAWFNYFGKVTREAGVAAFVWDNGAGGTSGGECHRYFNRKTGELVTPELSEAFINGYEPKAEAKNIFFDFEPGKQGDTSVIETPTEMGFEPRQLMKQAKINHTEDATVGFSLKVDTKIDNQTAYYDLSRFEGMYLNINAYLLVSSGSVEIGLGDRVVETLEANEDWKEVSFAIKVENATDALFFRGITEENFYIDDMSIDIIDEAAYNEAISNKEVETKPEGDSNEASIDNNNESKESVEKAAMPVRNIVLCIIALIALVVIFTVRRRALKKK
ncbi:MAG: glycoside hydrolase family 5 protein [Lachnospiraceae bacterium]|nr:glycoside hydrolase family 5 protein [Lachnospiraceae bacterium]